MTSPYGALSDELEGLIERVSRATEGSRELDGELHNALFQTAYVRSVGSVSGFFTSKTDNGCPYVDRYTSSMDDALALVKRMLPGWHVTIYGATGKTAAVNIEPELTKDGEPAWSPNDLSPPLAIISALLAALRSLQTGNAE